MVWGAFGWPDAAEPQKQGSADSEADYPECDYDQDLTPLYEAIEERAWIAVNQFLHSGYWPESLFPDKMSPEDQARTWVTRYETRPDGTKKVRWSQLPIHAAVIFGAPSVIIQQLVECFPQSVRCTDDHRMLPLHLAFRHGSDDSVLALFLEEFPEAVNVRGYKGRLPVECAKKGPNPERGAIIQTILHKNQSAWERKKSAVQLKELYCVKEALKIKSQKVSHLETAMREIKSREHKTRKELASTMTELKVMKGKKPEEFTNKEDLADKEAVKLLVEKLAALELATKDLVEKEVKTKQNLKKTLIELETLKTLKPTEEQAKQFAKLEQVASTEVDMLQRGTETDTLKSEKSEADKEAAKARQEESSVAEVKKVASKESAISKETPVSIQSSQEGAKKEEQKKKVPSVMKLLGMKKNTEPEEKQAKTLIEQTTGLLGSLAPQAKEETDEQKLSKTASREEDRRKLRVVQKANQALASKISKLEAAMKQFEEKASKKKHEMDLISCPDEDIKLTKKQAKKMKALEAEMEKLRVNAKKTKVELDSAMDQLVALKRGEKKAAEEMAGKAAEDQAKCKQLEKKVSVLKLALKQFEGKSSLAKKEMTSIKTALSSGPGVQLTDAQKNQMKVLEGAMKKLDNNAKTTKKELDSTIDELVELKATMRAEARLAKKDEVSAEAIKKDLKKELKKELLAVMDKPVDVSAVIAAAQAKGDQKIKLVEETNKQLEDKIKQMESTMKQFEDKASKTRQDMDKALDELKTMPEIEKEDKKHEKQVESLTSAMKHLEATAGKTQNQLESALKELAQLKAKEKKSSLNKAVNTQADNKALLDLSKKVAALQSAMVGFEVKETRTVQELEKTMKELEEVSKKRFEVLSATAEHTQSLVSDSHFTKEVARLDRKATKEEEKIAKLEATINEITSKSGNTKHELDRTEKILEEIKASSENLEESKQDKKIIKELTKKVASLQSAVLGFELKEGKTMKELENTMKQLEELTSKRFEMLEKAAVGHTGITEHQAEEKVNKLHALMSELQATSAATKAELEETKKDLDAMRSVEINPKGASQGLIEQQEQQIKELNEKINVLQSAVMGFEVKETKTMQELEQTMKQLEELTAKRFEVLQKVAGREIEAAKAAEATKYSQKAAQDEKKVAALEAAMRELESKAYKTKLELERTMKNLELLEEKQNLKQDDVSGVTREEKRIMRELVDKVASIQEAVTAYDEKEHKTDNELEVTRKELEETRLQVEALRTEQSGLSAQISDAESVKVVHNSDNDTVEVEDGEEDLETQSAAETAKRVTEETLASLENAIHHLVEKLGDEPTADATGEEQVGEGQVGEEQSAGDCTNGASVPKEVSREPILSKSGSLLTAESGHQQTPQAEESEMLPSPAEMLPAEGESEALQSSGQTDIEETNEALQSSGQTDTANVSESMSATAESKLGAAELSKPTKTSKKSSIFGRLVKKSGKDKKKKGFGIFGPRNNPSKTKTATMPLTTPAAQSPVTVTSPPMIKSAIATTAPTEPAPVTEEQRKEVAAIHGPEIAAVLSDQQILAILSKGQSKEKDQQEELAAVKSYESKSQASQKTAGAQDQTSGSLIAANTYEDGFEIKF